MLALSFMKPSEYKKQFITILRTAFPNGLPQGACTMGIHLNGTRYELVFDPEDFHQPRSTKDQPATLEGLLNERDLQYLRKLKIGLQDVEPQ